MLAKCQIIECLARARVFREHTYGPPSVDIMWGIWGSYYNIPKAIFYLLKGDYNVKNSCLDPYSRYA